MKKNIILYALAPIALLGSILIGQKGLDLKNYEHPDNPLMLKGSPLGIVLSKLVNNRVDVLWEKGEFIKREVNPQAFKQVNTSPLSWINAGGLVIDQLGQVKRLRTNPVPLSTTMAELYRIRASREIQYGFELDPTNDTALQLSLSFASEMDPSVKSKEYADRIKICKLYVDMALNAYNLDPEKGNPNHAISAADAKYTLFILTATLTQYGSRDNMKKVQAETIIQANKDILFAENLLAKRITNGSWSKSSFSRQMDFWSGYNAFKANVKAFDNTIQLEKPSIIMTNAIKRLDPTLSKTQIDKLVKDNLPVRVSDLQSAHLHHLKENVFTDKKKTK